MTPAPPPRTGAPMNFRVWENGKWRDATDDEKRFIDMCVKVPCLDLSKVIPAFIGKSCMDNEKVNWDTPTPEQS